MNTYAERQRVTLKETSIDSVGSVGTTTTTEEEVSLLELTEDSMSRERQSKIRMKKVDLEKIYPQAEKDREGERLRRLCELQEGRKSIHADGTRLIQEIVKPRKLEEMDKEEAEKKIKHSLNRSPEGLFFLDLIER